MSEYLLYTFGVVAASTVCGFVGGMIANCATPDHEEYVLKDDLIQKLITTNSLLSTALMGSFAEDNDKDDEGEDNSTPFSSSSSEEEIEDHEDIEIAQMFEEEEKRKGRTTSEILEIGRQIGQEPVIFPVRKGGGYASMTDISEAAKTSAGFKDKLSRADELEIMHTFNCIRGMQFYEALEHVSEFGYTLYPIRINGHENRSASVYSATTLGVEIEDKNYDYITSTVSNSAYLIEIVNVGGQI